MLKYGNSNIFLYLSAGVTVKENCCHAIFKNLLVHCINFTIKILICLNNFFLNRKKDWILYEYFKTSKKLAQPTDTSQIANTKFIRQFTCQVKQEMCHTCDNVSRSLREICLQKPGDWGSDQGDFSSTHLSTTFT